MIVDFAMEIIPREELSDDQKDRLDNIEYHFCKCRHCDPEGTFERLKHWSYSAHADRGRLKIGVSSRFFREDQEMSGFLLIWVETILHEVSHILYPENNEEQTENVAREWLSTFDWNMVFRSLTENPNGTSLYRTSLE